MSALRRPGPILTPPERLKLMPPLRDPRFAELDRQIAMLPAIAPETAVDGLRLWACFICGSESNCRHREPEIVAWAQERRNRYLHAKESHDQPKTDL